MYYCSLSNEITVHTNNDLYLTMRIPQITFDKRFLTDSSTKSKLSQAVQEEVEKAVMWWITQNTRGKIIDDS